MPVPSWALFRSPRPDDDNNQVHDPDVGGSPASQSSSRFGALHSNVRSMINGSSIYSSDSPRLLQPETPKTPFWGFLGRRPHSRPPPIDVISDNDAPRDSNDSRSPLRPQHTAGSYMRVIAPLQDPRVPEVVHNRHPADVPLNYGGSVDLETQQLQDEIHGRRRKRKHRRRRTQRHNHWVRRRSGSSSQDRGICFPFIKSQAARGKCVACMISGLFLTTVLAIYLALALSRKDLGQEIHVLFIMIILATTIFFCHSLIRLFMLALHPPAETPNIPSMTGPEGFHPVRPIRVHLVRDEESALVDEDDSLDREADDGEEKKAPLPPPAYGLWRSSVRVDPNLLHWQRVDSTPLAPPPGLRNSILPTSRAGSISGPAAQVPEPETQGPRPPSYVSDDGVSYVVEAAPRSVAPTPVVGSGVSDIHPAWRPGYAVSEVPTEWPVPRRV